MHVNSVFPKLKKRKNGKSRSAAKRNPGPPMKINGIGMKNKNLLIFSTPSAPFGSSLKNSTIGIYKTKSIIKIPVLPLPHSRIQHFSGIITIKNRLPQPSN